MFDGYFGMSFTKERRSPAIPGLLRGRVAGGRHMFGKCNNYIALAESGAGTTWQTNLCRNAVSVSNWGRGNKNTLIHLPVYIKNAGWEGCPSAFLMAALRVTGCIPGL
jgi:hypothetical protein